MSENDLSTSERRSILKMLRLNDFEDFKKWSDQVDHMPTKQVYAIFNKMKADGYINFDGDGKVFFRTKEEVKYLKKMRDEAKNGHQITLDEYLKEKEGIK